MFLDVYFGHINTIKHIEDNNNRAFHSMMLDIYTRARYVVLRLLYVGMTDIYDCQPSEFNTWG